VALLAWRQGIDGRHHRQPLERQALGEVERFERDADLVKLQQDLFVAKTQLARPLDEPEQGLPIGLASHPSHFMPECAESDGALLRRRRCSARRQRLIVSVLDLAIHEARSPSTRRLRKIVALRWSR
jgi:hypothetical protein